jgi:hypothetical protein
MTTYFQNREEVVEFVSDLLLFSEQGWPLTMTIRPEKSGAFSVRTVIGTSSEGIESLPPFTLLQST